MMPERRIRNHGHTVPLAPWDDRVLNRALLQMVEHLVAGDPAFSCQCAYLLEIVDIEITDAPGTDFSGTDQFLESRAAARLRFRDEGSFVEVGQ